MKSNLLYWICFSLFIINSAGSRVQIVINSSSTDIDSEKENLKDKNNESLILTKEQQPHKKNILSSNQWKKNLLAEIEEKGQENKNVNHAKRRLKLCSKNCVSPDCDDAKVDNINPEAGSVWALMSSSKDLDKREDESKNSTQRNSINEFVSHPCSIPAYCIASHNCSGNYFTIILKILCQEKQLEELMELKDIMNTRSCNLCTSQGLDLRVNNEGPSNKLKPCRLLTIQDELSHHVIAIVFNETTYETLVELNGTVRADQNEIPVFLADPPSIVASSTQYEAPLVATNSVTSNTQSSNTHIEHSKTLIDDKNLSASAIFQQSLSPSISDMNQHKNTSENVTVHSTSQPTKVENEQMVQGNSFTASSSEQSFYKSLAGSYALNLDFIFTEPDEVKSDTSTSVPFASLSPPKLSLLELKVAHLAKRIRSLERSMLLKEQYIEELSHWNKHQAEEMQRILTEFIKEGWRGEENEESRSQRIILLSHIILATVTAIQHNWILFFIALSATALALFACWWLLVAEAAKNRISTALTRTRVQSPRIETRLSVNNARIKNIHRPKDRRNSEKALRVSESECLIKDPRRKNSYVENRKRSRNVRKSDSKFVIGIKEESIQQVIPHPMLPPKPKVNGNVYSHTVNPSSRIRNNGSSATVNMKGNSRTLPAPNSPNYLQNAFSNRKRRTLSHHSTSELSDKDKIRSRRSTSIKESRQSKKCYFNYFK